MAKFHTKKDGSIGECRAKSYDTCPYGGIDEHIEAKNLLEANVINSELLGKRHSSAMKSFNKTMRFWETRKWESMSIEKKYDIAEEHLKVAEKSNSIDDETLAEVTQKYSEVASVFFHKVRFEENPQLIKKHLNKLRGTLGQEIMLMNENIDYSTYMDIAKDYRLNDATAAHHRIVFSKHFKEYSEHLQSKLSRAERFKLASNNNLLSMDASALIESNDPEIRNAVFSKDLPDGYRNFIIGHDNSDIAFEFLSKHGTEEDFNYARTHGTLGLKDKLNNK